MNLVTKLMNRKFAIASNRSLPKDGSVGLRNAFKPTVKCHVLRNVVSESLLMDGHVFLGFTRSGAYLLSYSVTEPEEDLGDEYGYHLHWWIFRTELPRPKLKLIRSVFLFKEAEIQNVLIVVSFWPEDDSKVLILGCKFRRGVEPGVCHVCVLPTPESHSISSRDSELDDSFRAFSVHTKFDLPDETSKRYIPQIFLRINNTAVISTGFNVVVFSVTSKLPHPAKFFTHRKDSKTFDSWSLFKSFEYRSVYDSYLENENFNVNIRWLGAAIQDLENISLFSRQAKCSTVSGRAAGEWSAACLTHSCDIIREGGGGGGAPSKHSPVHPPSSSKELNVISSLNWFEECMLNPAAGAATKDGGRILKEDLTSSRRRSASSTAGSSSSGVDPSHTSCHHDTCISFASHTFCQCPPSPDDSTPPDSPADEPEDDFHKFLPMHVFRGGSSRLDRCSSEELAYGDFVTVNQLVMDIEQLVSNVVSVTPDWSSKRLVLYDYITQLVEVCHVSGGVVADVVALLRGKPYLTTYKTCISFCWSLVTGRYHLLYVGHLSQCSLPDPPPVLGDADFPHNLHRLAQLREPRCVSQLTLTNLPVLTGRSRPNLFDPVHQILLKL